MTLTIHTEPTVGTKEGPQGHLEGVGKDETHPTFLASHGFQVLWPYNRDTHTYLWHYKHSTGKRAGCVASAHNASNHINIAGKKYLQQESPGDLWNC